MNKNYYDILGIDKNASENDIKKAYRKAAVKWHPDKWAKKSDAEKSNAEVKFKEINEAYDCLSNPEKKAHYDQFGSMEGFGQAGFGQGGFGGFDFSSFFDGFNPFGSEHRQRRQPSQAGSIQLNMGVTLEELFKGVHRKIEYTTVKRCHTCHGEGGKGVKTCPHCHGSGMITETKRTPFGIMQNSHSCQYCNGYGQTFEEVCHTCHGEGIEQVRESLQIDIDGPFIPHQFKYDGKGTQSQNPNVKDGDLYINIALKINDEQYAINGNDVYEHVTLDYIDCLLGCTKTMEHPSGETIELTIPECSDNGKTITIPHKGLGNAGDYIYVIHPKMPDHLTDNERKILKKLQ